MSTQWIYWLIVTTTDKGLCDPLGCALNPDPNTVEEFVTPLRAIGSGSLIPTAWASAAPMKAGGKSIVEDFVAGGYPAYFLAKGFSEAYLDACREVMTITHGTRADLERTTPAVLAAQGYEVMQDA
jgi:hypothetical protein